MTDQEQQTQTVEAPSPFAGTAWSENLPTQTQEGQPQETQAVETQNNASTETNAGTETQTAEAVQTTIPIEWLKTEFGVEDPALLKQEREELKRLKETPPTPAEIKFENEQSKLIHELIREGKTKEVRQFLETQERLDSFTSAEITKDNADDILKLGMQLRYKDLTKDEIDYKFNKEFGVPRLSAQAETETDDEFSERKTAWEEKVRDVEMNKLIEAKLMKPELEKAKSQIVLPELSKPQTPDSQTQESLAADQERLAKVRENFLNKLETDFSKTEGFSTKVKDESVEIPVAFKIPDEDKVAIKEMLKNGFNINEFFDKKWFDADGNSKIDQMISDLYLLTNSDKVLSGIANNGASQRLSEYRKQVNNVNINTGNGQTSFAENGGQQQNVSPFAQGAWSEKPPVLNHN